MKEERLTRFRTLMQAEKLDYFVLFIGPSFYYFTGLRMQIHERPTLLFISAESSDAIFLPKLEFPNARAILGDALGYYIYTDAEGWEKPFRNASEKLRLNGKRIGIEFMHMRVHEYDLLRRGAPEASFNDGTGIVAEVRMVKDEDEISLMKKAAEITEKALEATLYKIRPGATEEEVANENKLQMLRLGSGELWKQPIVTSGPRSAFPHAKTSGKKIAIGEIVMIDTGATYQGYTCDLTRTFAVDQLDEELKKVHGIVHDAVSAVIGYKANAFTAQELDGVARQVINQKGYGEYFIHRTGHGLGLEGHEPPYIVQGNKMPLREGMTFTVEPGIYLPERGGVRIEDDVVVTKSGVEELTHFPRELRILQ
jgi:Xaa-Pro dipeptidase